MLGPTPRWEMAVWGRDTILLTKAAFLLMATLPFLWPLHELIHLGGGRRHILPAVCAPGEGRQAASRILSAFEQLTGKPPARGCSVPSGLHTLFLSFLFMSMLWWKAETLLRGMFSHPTVHTQLAPAWYASQWKKKKAFSYVFRLHFQFSVVICKSTCNVTAGFKWWIIERERLLEKWLGREVPRGTTGENLWGEKVMDYEAKQRWGTTFPGCIC